MDVAELLTRPSESEELSDVADEAGEGAAELEEGELAAEQPLREEAAGGAAAPRGGGGARAAAGAAQYSAKVRAAAKQIATALCEKKLHLLLELCARFGVPLARRVLQQTLEVERAGGVATTDGSRRRERGGAYAALFKASVPAEAWRAHAQAMKRIDKARRKVGAARKHGKEAACSEEPGEEERRGDEARRERDSA